MSDALVCGRRVRTFNVLVDFNRKLLHIQGGTMITSARRVGILEQLHCDDGTLPQVLRSDCGPELLGVALVQWTRPNGTAIQHIQPGKPKQNGYIERFNRTFRVEVVDQHLVLRHEDVREAARW